jgi:hypothetical protein
MGFVLALSRSRRCTREKPEALRRRTRVAVAIPQPAESKRDDQQEPRTIGEVTPQLKEDEHADHSFRDGIVTPKE